MDNQNQNKPLSLEHYSPKAGLKTISPKYKRTGVDSGKRVNQLSHDISFFYPAGTEPEPIVANRASSKYTVNLSPEHKVYHPETHGREHIQAVKDKNNGVFNLDMFISHLKENGFHGFHTSPQGISMVAMFDDVDTHSEEPMQKSEKKEVGHGDHVYLSHGRVNQKRPGVPMVDKRQKYVARGKKKSGYRTSMWVVPHGEKDTKKGFYHRHDRMHHVDGDHDHYDSHHENNRMKKQESQTNDLQKSKNVKEQKQKTWGRTSQPSAKSPMREKHMDHIRDYAQRRYGLNMKPSGGKMDMKTGERRSENPEVGVDKPDWRSGELEAQANPDAMVHELGHLEIMPKDVGLEQGQAYMDQQYTDVQQQYGYMKQKQSQGEVQPMGIEQLLRRRMGLPANRSVVPVDKDAPPRRAVDTGDVVGTRIKTGKKKTGEAKYGDLIRQSRFVNQENRERVDKIDRKELVYDRKKGWVKPDVSTKEGLKENINSVINIRAREKAKDPSRKDSDTLMRSEDGEKESE